MSVSRRQLAKRNGVYFTPEPIASYLANHAIQPSHTSIIDPACGEGALLRAFRSACLDRGGARRIALWACDRLDRTKALSGIDSVRFVKGDFLTIDFPRKFDLIIMNPPFLAIAKLPVKVRDRYRKGGIDLIDIPLNADLWAYFILRSAANLSKGGAIAAILPWAVLQARYAIPLRSWMCSQFQSIQALALTKDHFESTNTKVVLLWLNGFGLPSESMKIACSQSIEATHVYRYLTREAWQNSPLDDVGSASSTAILAVCREYGFVEFGDTAKVEIGVVTGANGYFIVSNDDKDRLGLRDEDLIPILTASSEITKLCTYRSAACHRLFQISPGKREQYESYIRMGVRNRIHLRSHCRRRQPWYQVDPGDTPDAFFHYRVSSTPFLSLNKGNLQSTNSIHRVYFKKASTSERRWIQISLLSTIGQLAIELRSRIYGNGALKVEPYALKRVLVWPGKTELPPRSYNQVSALLREGRRHEAVQIASDMLWKTAKLPSRLKEDFAAALRESQMRRSGRIDAIPDTKPL